jgi:hypothetical protein
MTITILYIKYGTLLFYYVVAQTVDRGSEAVGLDSPYYLADVDAKQMMDQRLPKRCQKIGDEQGQELLVREQDV